MKKLNLIVFLLFVSCVGFAQNKFIEVSVTDTVSLKPVRFKVDVFIDHYKNRALSFSEDDDVLLDNEANDVLLQAFKTKLEEKKYKLNPIKISKESLFRGDFWGSNKNGWTIYLEEKEELDRLSKLIDSEDKFSGYVTVLEYADEDKAEERLIGKLIDKAKKRANVIAYSSQLEVGSVIEVKEGNGSWYEAINVGDTYFQMMKDKMGLNDGDYTGSMSKTFVVKFSAQ